MAWDFDVRPREHKTNNKKTVTEKVQRTGAFRVK